MNRLLTLLLLLCSFSLNAQLLQQTHLVEAYNCSCGEAGKLVNSIQLGVRLDRTQRFFSALSTLVGCSRIVLNVDGERYPVRITMASARDNVATLEPIEMSSNIAELEKKLKKAPNYMVMAPTMELGTRSHLVVLEGAGMKKQQRTLVGSPLVARHRGGELRYVFTMEHGEKDAVIVDGLMGGPVWVGQGKEYLAGIVTGKKEVKGGFAMTVAGVENVLDKSRFQLYHSYLSEFSEELETDCGPKQMYWDGFGNYRYRSPDKPQYKRIAAEDPWERSVRTSMLRIRAHMTGEIPARGNSRDGEPSLCVFANDLENAHQAFLLQANATERDNWPVLPRFIKVYSNVYCKQRKYADTDFIRDIVELNYWMEQISGDEVKLLYELGYDWSAFEGFVKQNYMVSQVSGIRKRYDGLMSPVTTEPCTQRLMLEELESMVKDWSRYVGVSMDPNYDKLLQYRKALAQGRDSLMAVRLVALQADQSEVQVKLDAIERDSCLSGAEKLRLTKAVRDLSVDVVKEGLDYGIDVVDQVRSSISAAFGEDALANVITRVFRVEGGVGVELTMRGGGAILNKRLRGKTDSASDTTTTYRSGFPLGSVGDTLSATIAQVFWQRMCDDYSSRKWEYRTESMAIKGMADGVPVRSRLSFSEGCMSQLAKQGIDEPNEQLAFARAWGLREQISQCDNCGLYDLINPTIEFQTYAERDGAYRGVVIRAVMKRL